MASVKNVVKSLSKSRSNRNPERTRLAAELRDLQAQQLQARRNFTSGLEDLGIEHGKSMSGIGQTMGRRGFGFGGLRLGEEGRQLEDFSRTRGEMATGFQDESDALERAMTKTKALMSGLR